MDSLKINPNVDLKIEKVAEKQLANIFESLLGAIFLDGGLEPCRNLILSTVWTHREIAWENTNYKGKLITKKETERNPKYDNGKAIYLFNLNKAQPKESIMNGSLGFKSFAFLSIFKD